MSSKKDLFSEVYSSSNDLFSEVYNEKPSKKLTVSEKATERFRPGAGGKALLRGLSKAAMSVQEMGPLGALGPTGPISKSQQEDILEKLLGDPEAGFSEKTIERGAEIAPFLVGGEGAIGAKLGRAGLSALLGQTTEELGGGQISQTAAELLGLGLPGLGKKIIPAKGQTKTLEMLRRRGLSEKEIAPLIPSKTKSEILGVVAKKGGRGQKAVENTQKAMGRVYDQLRQEGTKAPILATADSNKLQTTLSEHIDDFSEDIAKLIRNDTEKMFRKPITSKSLMDLWFKINDNVFGKKITRKKALLNSLKTPLMEEMKKIDPQIAEDFSLIQENYAHFKKSVAKTFKPNLIDRFLKIGKLKQFIVPLVTGKFLGLKGALISEGSRRITTEFLINPRLQNLTRQMITAVNNNKIAIAKKIHDQMIKELKKKDGIDKIPEESSNLQL